MADTNKEALEEIAAVVDEQLETEEETEGEDDEWREEVKAILSGVLAEYAGPIMQRLEDQQGQLHSLILEMSQRPTTFPELMSAMERQTAMIQALTETNTALVQTQAQSIQAASQAEATAAAAVEVATEVQEAAASDAADLPAVVTTEPGVVEVPEAAVESPRRKHRRL